MFPWDGIPSRAPGHGLRNGPKAEYRFIRVMRRKAGPCRFIHAWTQKARKILPITSNAMILRRLLATPTVGARQSTTTRRGIVHGNGGTIAPDAGCQALSSAWPGTAQAHVDDNHGRSPR